MMKRKEKREKRKEKNDRGTVRQGICRGEEGGKEREERGKGGVGRNKLSRCAEPTRMSACFQFKSHRLID